MVQGDANGTWPKGSLHQGSTITGLVINLLDTNNNTKAPNTECDLGRFHHDCRSSLPLQAMAKPTTAPAEAKHTHKTQGAKQHKREEAYLQVEFCNGEARPRKKMGEGATPDSGTTCKKECIARAIEIE